MKKNSLIFILVFGFILLFSSPVFAYTYTRTPAGYNAYNPVNTSFSASSYEELTSACGLFNVQRIRLQILSNTSQEFYSNWVDYPNLSVDWLGTFPFGEYKRVAVVCILGGSSAFIILEYNAGNTIFEIGEPPPPPLFGYPSNFNTNFATSVFGFGSQLLYDLRVVLYILVGLALGMGIILIVLNWFEDKKTK